MKPKPKIEKIAFTEDQKREIKDMLDGKPSQNVIKYWQDKGMNVSHKQKWYTAPQLHNRIRDIQRKYLIGVCVMYARIFLYTD